MTSLVSSANIHPARHDLMIALRTGLGSRIISLLLLIFLQLFTVPTLALLTTRQLFLQRFLMSESMGYERYFMLLLLAYSVAQAIFSFPMLFRRSTATYFFGLGLSRTRLFLSRFLVGSIWLILAVLLAIIGAEVTKTAAGQFDLNSHSNLLFGASLLLPMLVGYALTVWVGAQSGTTVETAVYSGLLLSALSWLLLGLRSQISVAYLVFGRFGQVDVVTPLWYEKISGIARIIDPLLFSDDFIAANITRRNYYTDQALPSWGLLFWLCLFLILMVLAYRCFLHRHVENTGIIGDCRTLGLIALVSPVYAAFALPLAWTVGLIWIPWPVAVLIGLILSSLVFWGVGLPLRLIGRGAWHGLYAYAGTVAAAVLITIILFLHGPR
jgi:hypothetical protein